MSVPLFQISDAELDRRYKAEVQQFAHAIDRGIGLVAGPVDSVTAFAIIDALYRHLLRLVISMPDEDRAHVMHIFQRDFAEDIAEHSHLRERTQASEPGRIQ